MRKYGVRKVAYDDLSIYLSIGLRVAAPHQCGACLQ